MQETLNNHHAPIGCRPISHLRFADDIGLMVGTIIEIKDITNILYDRAEVNMTEVSI
ncbi:hypothetical protein DPMN_165438 [Dreissena polymorpha]|uniref:Uncharacterized protein n=1 Tax=Dreissena polymorpha TaxID=45954 RepID=A0A9D4EW38_DREPO|nr:hypothetical protein DPMN_165438 [Dreissena polymorpha]